MANLAKLSIRASFARPDAAELKPFKGAPTGWVVDAQGRRGALAHWLKPVTAASRFVGNALTVRTRPVDNLAPYVALKFARPGDVLVIDTGGGASASVLGDVLVGMARNAGVVAVVTDGLARDIEGLNGVGIPVFARGVSPNSPFKDGPGAVGVAVNLAGSIVNPGDVLVGDDDGVVVVPRQDVGRVGVALSTVAAKERDMDQAVSDGARYPAWVDDVLDAGGVGYLDDQHPDAADLA